MSFFYPLPYPGFVYVRVLPKTHDILPDTYGFWPKHLAEIMTTWQEAAGADVRPTSAGTRPMIPAMGCRNMRT